MLPSELIANPEHWTKGTNARNAKGDQEQIESKDAFSFCMIGAILRCDIEISCEKLNKIGEKLGMSIMRFNDNPETTHADVIIALKSVGL